MRPGRIVPQKPGVRRAELTDECLPSPYRRHRFRVPPGRPSQPAIGAGRYSSSVSPSRRGAGTVPNGVVSDRDDWEGSMSRTESPEGATGSANGGGYVSGPGAAIDSAALVRWAGRLASYAVATLAVTFVLLRPTRRGPTTRGSLFLGSGVLVVLFKTIFLGGDGAETAPTRPVPAVAAAAPATKPPAGATGARNAKRVERRKSGVS